MRRARTVACKATSARLNCPGDTRNSQTTPLVFRGKPSSVSYPAAYSNLSVIAFSSMPQAAVTSAFASVFRGKLQCRPGSPRKTGFVGVAIGVLNRGSIRRSLEASRSSVHGPRWGRAAGTRHTPFDPSGRGCRSSLPPRLHRDSMQLPRARPGAGRPDKSAAGEARGSAIAHRSPATIIRGQLPPGWSDGSTGPCALVASRLEAPRPASTRPAGGCGAVGGSGEGAAQKRDRRVWRELICAGPPWWTAYAL